jgi:hypothetical protein
MPRLAGLGVVERGKDALGDTDAAEVCVSDDQDVLDLVCEMGDESERGVGGLSGGPGDREVGVGVAGGLGSLEVLGVERDGAAKAEVGATAKSKCEQRCFAGAPVEQDGGDVLTGPGVGEVGLAEGAPSTGTRPTPRSRRAVPTPR